MKARIAVVTLVTAALVAATGCSSMMATKDQADIEQQLRQKEQQISELQSSMKRLETDLERQSAEARAKAEAAEAAQRAARDAEAKARAAEEAALAAKAASDTTAGAKRATALTGGEMLPPNARPGTCYARAFVPPTYRTETVQVLKREAAENLEVIPAKYEWVEERVLVQEASSKMVEIPAKYEWVEEQVLVEEAHTVWKKGRGPIEKVDNATGEIMCLVEVPAKYKTVRKRVMTSPPRTEKTEIPAEYKTIKVKKMVQPPQERRTTVPAQYDTVTKTELVTEGGMAWREILCETNMSPDVITKLQRALDRAGFNPGPIDGIYGSQTRNALRSYQQKNGLATGGLTMGTLKKLGVIS